jgi:hypothetical protein
MHLDCKFILGINQPVFHIVHTSVYIKIKVLSQCGKCQCYVFGFIYTIIVLFEESVHVVGNSSFCNTSIKVVYAE